MDDSPISLVELEFRRAKAALFKRNVPLRPHRSIPVAAATKGVVVADNDKNSQSINDGKARAQVALCVGQQAVGHKACELKLDEFRPFRITARFSESEREILVRRAQEARLTTSEYIRASVLGAGYVSIIDPTKREFLKNTSRELGRQGTNLNQIAKHLNSGMANMEEGNSMLAIIARSLLSAHQSVRQALTDGKTMP